MRIFLTILLGENMEKEDTESQLFSLTRTAVFLLGLMNSFYTLKSPWEEERGGKAW